MNSLYARREHVGCTDAHLRTAALPVPAHYNHVQLFGCRYVQLHTSTRYAHANRIVARVALFLASCFFFRAIKNICSWVFLILDGDSGGRHPNDRTQ